MSFAIFPLDLPSATAFYIVLYVLVFIVHQALMHYVLGGCVYLTWTALSPGKATPSRGEQPLAMITRDWLPFALSAAITAGVAPLLFIQILYPTAFYTANLLLFWRWLLVVPVMISAFYALYGIKSWSWTRWRLPARAALVGGVAFCFFAVGMGWSTNHVIAGMRQQWPAIYTDGLGLVDWGAVVARVGVWAPATWATWAMMISWQAAHNQEADLRVPGFGAMIAVAASTAMAVVVIQNDEIANAAGHQLTLWLALLWAGVLFQLVGWWRHVTTRTVGSRWLVTLGSVSWLASLAFIREWMRVAACDLPIVSQRHTEAASIGGFGVFLASAVACGALSVYCLRIANQARKTSRDTRHATNEEKKAEH